MYGEISESILSFTAIGKWGGLTAQAGAPEMSTAATTDAKRATAESEKRMLELNDCD